MVKYLFVSIFLFDRCENVLAIRRMHVLQQQNENKNTVHVAIRLIFLRVGELNTRDEQFEAHIALEARWFVETTDEQNRILSSLSNEDQNRFINGNIIKLSKDFPEHHWHPQLFLLNISRDRIEDIKYTLKRTIHEFEIREFRDIDAKFYSKFDLHYFPTDIQELNVSIGSALFDTEVTLEVDPNRTSGINREAFIDQQEWKLYDHIETKTKFIKGFLFQNDEDNELDTPGHEKKRSILIISCHAGKQFVKNSFLEKIFFGYCSTSNEIFLLEWFLSHFLNHNYWI